MTSAATSWLADIVAFCDEIAQCCATGQRAWLDDPVNVAATSYLLIKAAHAAEQAVAAHVRQQEPWRRLTGVRNRLAHDYRHIDLTLLWSVATIRVAEVRSAAVAAMADP
jgi:uncharacterized protein with HEPN domain